MLFVAGGEPGGVILTDDRWEAVDDRVRCMLRMYVIIGRYLLQFSLTIPKKYIISNCSFLTDTLHVTEVIICVDCSIID